MSRTHVKNLKIKGTSISVEVNDEGKFFGQFGDESYSDTTLLGLERTLQHAAKVSTTYVKIPFTMVRWDEADHDPADVDAQDGVGIGIHSGNNNTMVKLAGSRETQQLRRCDRYSMYRFAPAERKMLTKLVTQYAKGHKALKKFLDSKAIDLRQEIEAEVNKAFTSKESSDAEGKVS